jgi:hypothetical protein
MIGCVQCDPREVWAHLQAAKSAKTDSADVFDLAAVVGQGVTFKLLDEQGATVGAYTLAAYGRLLWVLAAAGRAPFDLSREIFALIESQGQAFDAVGFRTERPGLVRKARAAGYQITKRDGPAFFLRKDIR